MRGRRSFRSAVVAAGLASSALFAYLAVRGVDLERFRESLADSDYRWLVPALVVLATGIFLRAVRWRLLFEAQTRPPLGATIRAMLIGYFFNSVLPARAGEALRVVALHEDAGTSRAEALGTAISERVYDVLVLLVLLFAAVPWLPEVTWLRRAAFVAIVFAGAFLVAVGALLVWRERPLRYALRPLTVLPGVSPERLDAAAQNLVLGLVAVRRARIALPALALSFVAILVIACSFWLVTFAFDLELGFGAGLLVMITTNLAMVIPSSTAAIGVFEASTVLALHAYGVDRPDALSYAVVLHALNVLPFVVAGLVLLPRYGFRVRG